MTKRPEAKPLKGTSSQNRKQEHIKILEKVQASALWKTEKNNKPIWWNNRKESEVGKLKPKSRSKNYDKDFQKRIISCKNIIDLYEI